LGTFLVGVRPDNRDRCSGGYISTERVRLQSYKAFGIMGLRDKIGCALIKCKRSSFRAAFRPPPAPTGPATKFICAFASDIPRIRATASAVASPANQRSTSFAVEINRYFAGLALQLASQPLLRRQRVHMLVVCVADRAILAVAPPSGERRAVRLAISLQTSLSGSGSSTNE
jgi:hypothetical protein